MPDSPSKKPCNNKIIIIDNPTLFSAMFHPSIPVVAPGPSGSVLTTWAIAAVIAVALVILSAVITLVTIIIMIIVHKAKM